MARSIHFFLFCLPLLLLGTIGCDGHGGKTHSVTPVEGSPQIQAQIAPDLPRPAIALIMKTLTNPFFVEMERGARQAEKELGVRLLVQTAAQETSIEQQIQIVNQNIRSKVDAIVIAPGDSLELIPALKRAQDAGIIIINIDNRLDPAFSRKLDLETIPFISVDNEQAAYSSAQYVSTQISTPTQAIILEGIRGANNAEERKQGAIRAFEQNPNITLVATETAHWKIDEGYQVTKALFERFPGIGVIFAANDMMALGAIKHLRETGRSKVLVSSFDAVAQARQAIREGQLAVTIDQRAAKQGYLAVHYAVKALAGEPLPNETTLDSIVVNATSLKEAKNSGERSDS